MHLTRSERKPGPKSHVFGNTLFSADHAFGIFDSCRDDLQLNALFVSKGLMEVEAALWKMDDVRRAYVLRRWGLAILKWIKEKKYPRQNPRAILRHLADSIAGEGNVSPRRSRDICSELRRKEKRVGKIIRRDSYIECTCGYKGPALRDACPKCGAAGALFELGEAVNEPGTG